MIIAVTSLKGGVGKSTITLNLAVCFVKSGYKTCIIDCDENQSSMKWSAIRDSVNDEVPVFGIPDGNALRANIKPLNNDYEIVLIDGTPSLSKTTSTIILLSHIVIIPITPGVLDIWATEKFLEHHAAAEMLKGEKIPSYFVLNKFNPKIKSSKEVRELLTETENKIPVFGNSLKERVAYKEAIIEGLGVIEYKDLRAKAETIELYNEIINKIQGHTKIRQYDK